MDGWPCQGVSYYKYSKLASESVKKHFVGNYASRMAKPRFWAFLGLLRLRCLNDKTSLRFHGEDITDCLQSRVFDMREKKMGNLGG